MGTGRTYRNHFIDPIEAFDNHSHPSGVPSMEIFLLGTFAAILVGATAAFGYVVYVDHSGRTARKRRLTMGRN
jgi:hypothetical protein